MPEPEQTVRADARLSEEARRPLSTPSSSPALPALIAAVAGTAFVLARLALAAKGDITRFIVAGRHFVDPALAPPGLHVFPSGYDGQFYYRLALDPLDLAKTAFGITLDSAFRVGRIGYPMLSWVAVGGQRQLIPCAEVGVNLAALVILAWLGGVIALDAGRHAAWGLLVVGCWGFLFSIGRDLPEVVGSCFLVGGLVALRRQRGLLAGLLFAGAALTIETTLDVVIAVALVSIIGLLRRRRRPGALEVAWILPFLAFAGWQAYGWAATGQIPVLADSNSNIGLPAVSMIGAVVHYVELLPSHESAIWLGEYLVLAIITLIAAWCVVSSRIPLWEKAAWGIAVLVGLSLARGIWYGTADFRAFEDVYVLSAILLLGSRHRLYVPAALVAIAWFVTFARRAVTI